MTRATSELAHLFRALKAPRRRGRCPSPPTGPVKRAGATSSSRRCSSRPRSTAATHTARARIKRASFPARKTLEEFDFAFQRSI